jgi:hypothetical protein
MNDKLALEVIVKVFDDYNQNNKVPLSTSKLMIETLEHLGAKFPKIDNLEEVEETKESKK